MKDYAEFCRRLFDLCEECQRLGFDDEVNLMGYVGMACNPPLSDNDLAIMRMDFEHMRSLRRLNWEVTRRKRQLLEMWQMGD